MSAPVASPDTPIGAAERADRLGHLIHLCDREDCLLYTSDAADERSSVDLGGRRIIKKKKRDKTRTIAPLAYPHETHRSTKLNAAEES